MDFKKLSKIADSCIKDDAESTDITVPTVQELFEHFSELVEDIKNNPNWKGFSKLGKRPTERKSNLGEWETICELSNLYTSTGRCAISLDVTRVFSKSKRVITDGFYNTYDSEWLEENLNDVIQLASESIVEQLTRKVLEFKNALETVKKPSKRKSSKKVDLDQLVEEVWDVIAAIPEAGGVEAGEIKGLNVDVFIYAEEWPEITIDVGDNSETWDANDYEGREGEMYEEQKNFIREELSKTLDQ